MRRDRVLEVGPGEAGARLDVFLAVRLGVSRAEARRLLAEGAVVRESEASSSVDSPERARVLRLAAKGAAVAVGTRLRVEGTPSAAERRPRPAPELALTVLAEGPGYLAVEKPAGMPVHPLRETEGNTVLNAIVARWPEVVGVGEGGLRSGVVHRLDVDTSGVLLVATQEATWRRLRGAFRAHRVAKTYRALVLGGLEGAGEERPRLAVSRHRPARVRVVADDVGVGRPTRLRWRALEVGSGWSLLEVEPATGFLHQIRATLAHLGHPVAGDRVYGLAAPADPTRAPRQMLHAARIAFGEIEARSPDPPDLAGVLARLRAAA